MVEYVGLDVSKEETAYCVKDADGKILAQGKVATDPDVLFAVLKEHCVCPERIVMETGTQSGWLSRELRKRGLPVECLEARQVHGVLRLRHNKTDTNDAEGLAELARLGFCHAVAIKSEAAQADRVLVKARAQLVSGCRGHENALRGLLASMGLRFPLGVATFAENVRELVADRSELVCVVEAMLSAREGLLKSIAALDREVAARARRRPDCQLLMSVPHVKSLTALTFCATIDDPWRFSGSRAVGAYLGLTSRRWQSGQVDYGGRISKMGDSLMRSLLYQAANGLLTRVRRAHPLKDWARKLKKRTSHKKAVVALARKLAVILHKMLITGEPFRWPQNEEASAKA
ncbi:MAG: IS110 family transposase [Xanthomonadales bacterium]|jgi:transposase|nr:IS110 family transposase [Xanthomonadales bacterium]